MLKKIILITFIIVPTLISCGPQYNLIDHGVYIQTGLENFLACHWRRFKGKKTALVTNHSGVNRYLEHNTTLLTKKGITISVIFAPEHGIYGHQNNYDTRKNLTEKGTGIPVMNMHKLRLKELKKELKDIEVVFFDIQDMGMRCYTYISNLKYIMDAIKGTSTKLVVFDRPNPIGFLGTDGAMLEPKFRSRFISAFPAPFIYNMTMGESARYYRSLLKEKVKLEVIPMLGYQRDMTFQETGLPWVPPSPNLPTYESAITYTAMVMLEGINISVGRGTVKPFEYIGAPWIDPVSMSRDLNRILGKNFRFKPVYFTPLFGTYKGVTCGGVEIFYQGEFFSPTDTAYILLSYLFKKYKQARWDTYKSTYDIDFLTGTDAFRKYIDAKKSLQDYNTYVDKQSMKYRLSYWKYLLY